MGRYYNGDIEGKFWFGVQASDDASFFGGEMYEPNYIGYRFEDSDIENIELGINKCKDALGENKDLMDKYFNEHNYYNDDDLVASGIGTLSTLKDMLAWYARLQLGEKIYNYVKENGSCEFEAET